MSVPQIVVVVTLSRASRGPISGIGFSSSTMRPGSTKIAAFILGMSDLLRERRPVDEMLAEDMVGNFHQVLHERADGAGRGRCAQCLADRVQRAPRRDQHELIEPAELCRI